MSDRIQLFENQPVRAAWDEEKEEWYFSVVDVVGILSESVNPAAYWRKLKQRLKEEGNETVTNCHGLKMLATDGKRRVTDVADTEQLLRIIQSIPSPKAEPFKMWLAQVGRERPKEKDMNQIMILGTFHMAGSCDVHGQAQEGISSERRQKEIQQLLDKLKEFRPTRIAVEVERKNQIRLNQRYQEYLGDKLQLTENEVHQIGFRLAKQLGHEQIYCVDWMEQGASTRGCGEVCSYLEEKEPELFKEIERYENDAVMLDEATTMIEAYCKMNSRQYEENTKAYYVNYARIGVEEDYYGMGWLTWWYQRNLIIFANLADLVEKDSDERVLLLIGNAHKGILNELLSDSKSFEVVDTLEYLV